MATPEAMIQAFTAMLQAQQAQTLEMRGGLQRQFQETIQGMMAGTKGGGKGGNGQEGLKGIPKMILYKGGITCTRSGKPSSWRT